MKLFNRNKVSPIDKEIDSIHVVMLAAEPGSETYNKQIAALERLHRLKANMSRKPVSSDTLAIVLSNVFGILVIVGYERMHVLTSKALTQLHKPNQPKNPLM